MNVHQVYFVSLYASHCMLWYGTVRPRCLDTVFTIFRYRLSCAEYMEYSPRQVLESAASASARLCGIIFSPLACPFSFRSPVHFDCGGHKNANPRANPRAIYSTLSAQRGFKEAQRRYVVISYSTHEREFTGCGDGGGDGGGEAIAFCAVGVVSTWSFEAGWSRGIREV